MDSWRSPGYTHSREAAKATGQAGGHWERRRRAAPAGEATVMPGDARPAQGQKPRRPALTRGPAQSAKHTHTAHVIQVRVTRGGASVHVKGLLPAGRTRG